MARTCRVRNADNFVRAEVRSLARTGLILVLIWSLAAPPAMRANDIQWQASAGDFAQGSNWMGGLVPSATDNAIINATNPISTLSFLNPGEHSQVNALTLGSSTVTLAVSGAMLTVGNSSGGTILTNGGVLNVNDGGTLTLLNTSGSLAMGGSAAVVSNSGSINIGLSDGSDHGILSLSGANATFNLGDGETGSVTLSDNANNLIKGVNGTESLINDAGHTIQGSGTIQNFANFTNNGILNANGTQGLILDLGASGTFTNGGSVNVTGGDTLSIASDASTSITNTGNIYLGASASDSGVLKFGEAMESYTYTLTGAGTLTLSNNSNNQISGVTGTESLINDSSHTIQGSGLISNFASFTNNGILNSNAGGTLTVDTSANLSNWSSGTLTGGSYVASNGSTLQLSALGSGGTIQTLSGALLAVFDTSLITGSDGTTNALTGLTNVTNASVALYGISSPLSITPLAGTLTLTNSNFTSAYGSSVIVNGSYSQDSSSVLTMQNGGSLRIASPTGATLTNSGNIYLGASSTDSGTLSFNGSGQTFLLTGGGTLTMSDNAGNTISGVTGGESLTNDAGHTIQGSGSISNFASFINNGILNANGSTSHLMGGPTSAGLTLDLGASGTFTNGGTVNVTNGSTLTIVSGNSTNIITNSGNINLTSGSPTAGSLVLNDQGNAATFTLTGGGTLTLDAGNVLKGYNGDETLINASDHTITGSGTISNLHFTNNGTVVVGSSLMIDASQDSTFTNTGGAVMPVTQRPVDPGHTGITLPPGYNVSDGATFTIQDLSGNGSTTLNNSGNIYLNSAGNDRTILANVTTLLLNSGTFTNTFNLTSGGQIIMTDFAGNTIAGENGNESLNNVNNLIAGSGVISNFANFTNGGMLQSNGANGLTIDLRNSSPNTGRQDTFVNAASGQVQVSGGSTLTIAAEGSTYINNSGTITIGDGSGNAGSLVLNAAKFIFGGSGSINLNNGVIYGSVAGETLVNASQQTITGSGTIDSTVANFTNHGTLETGADNTLTVNSTLTNWNSGTSTLSRGTYIVDDGGTLQLTSIGTGSPLNLQSANLTVTGASHLFGSDHATSLLPNLTSLTDSSVTLNGQSLTITPSTGTLTLTADSSRGGQNQTNLAVANNSMVSVTSNFSNGNGSGISTLSVTDNSSFTIGGTFNNVLSGGVLSGGNYLIGTNSSLNYTGAAITEIAANTGLTLDNAGSGTIGTVANAGMGSDAISKSLATNNGTLTVQNNASLALTAASFTNGSSGAINVLNNSTLDLTGLTGAAGFTNVLSGGVLSGGSYTVGYNSFLNYSGPDNINTIDHATSLTLDNTGGGCCTTGMIQNSGTGSLVDALSNSLTTNNGTLTVQNNAYVALNAASFTNGSSGAINVLNNSTLDLTNTTFSNVSTGALIGGSYTIGSGAILAYNNPGVNITSIGAATSLTLDNTGGTLGGCCNTTGTIQNGGSDALSGFLSTNNGTLTVQNNAYLGLGAASFTNNGAVNVLNGSLLDLTNTIFTNVTATPGTLSGGSYKVGNSSILAYSGTSNINTIDFNTSLTLDNTGGTPGGCCNTTGIIVNANTGMDALSNSLTANNGTLTVQNNAYLALGATSFTNSGTVNVLHDSILDLTNTGFTNVTGTPGTLSGGSYTIGSGSALFYNGSVISTIDTGTSLTLEGGHGGTGELLIPIVAEQGLSGSGQAATHASGLMSSGQDALSSSLSNNKGTLTLDHYASLTLTVGSFDNTGTLAVNDNSNLTVSAAFTNTGTVTLTGPAMNMFTTAPGVVNPTGIHTTMGPTTEIEVTNGDFTNSALGMVTIGENTSLVVENGNYTQMTGGTTMLAGGSLTISNAMDGVNIDGGTLTGGGTIDGNLTVDTGGTVNPGGDPAPTILTVTGNYVQTAAGFLDLDVVSLTSHDELVIEGTAILDGTLEITLDPSFNATSGEFEIASFGLGTPYAFSTFIDPVFDDANGHWETFEQVLSGTGPNSTLSLEIVSASAPTPEPSTFGMLFCAMLLGAGIRWNVRRRRAVIS